MTKLENEAWKIGMAEALKQGRIVPAAQSKAMMGFLRQNPSTSSDCIPWLAAYNQGVADAISLQLRREL